MAFTDDDFWYHLGEIVDLKRSGHLTSDEAKWHLSNLMTSQPGLTVVQTIDTVEKGATVIGYKADMI